MTLRSREGSRLIHVTTHQATLPNRIIQLLIPGEGKLTQNIKISEDTVSGEWKSQRNDTKNGKMIICREQSWNVTAFPPLTHLKSKRTFYILLTHILDSLNVHDSYKVIT